RGAGGRRGARQVQDERGACADDALGDELAAEDPSQVPGDRQAEPGAARRLVELNVFAEDGFQLLARDPRTGVFDGEPDPSVGAGAARRRVVGRDGDVTNGNGDPAGIRELHGVGEQVEEDLAQPAGVRAERRGGIGAVYAQL